MDYRELTAPCGLDCFNCTFYLATQDPAAQAQVEKWSEQYQVPVAVMLCRGCRAHDGQIPLQRHLFGEAHRCAAYECAKSKEHHHCGECDDFPCDYLHPYADRAAELPHNMKVFNLCLINKMGLDKWAESKAAEVRTTYFGKPWTLAK
ncbi:MAG: DUF3795 domain-containing protein [Deltaproteobacteria bacterium]|nr:DUF3795 domain-containing protein [Deltaproteobacteria bacterium]